LGLHEKVAGDSIPEVHASAVAVETVYPAAHAGRHDAPDARTPPAPHIAEFGTDGNAHEAAAHMGTGCTSVDMLQYTFGAVGTYPTSHVSEQKPGDWIVAWLHVLANAITPVVHGGGIGAEAGGGAIGASGGGGEGTQDGSEGIIEDELHSTRPPEGMYPTSHDNEQYSPAEMVTWLQVVAWAITGVVQGGGVLGEQEGTG